MASAPNQEIQQFRQQVRLYLLLKYGLIAATVWAFLYGTTVLALRGATNLDRLDLLWGLVTFPVAFLPAALLALRRVPSLNAIRSLLDRHTHCGGLLMTQAERSIGAWEEELPRIRQPGLQWQGQRTVSLFGLGTAFVLVAFLLPQQITNFIHPHLDVSKETEKLAKQLDVLEQEKILEAQRAEELKANLEQVRRDARGKDPIKTLESLDHLQDVANKAAQEAAENATRKMEELGRSEQFAEALEKMAGKLDKGTLTEAMKEMSAMTLKAATERELLESGLDKETLEAIKNSTLTPEQAKKLLDALKNAKEGTKKKIGKLVKAKLLKAEDLAKCEKAGECDCEGLAAYLKENGASTSLAEALAMSEEGGKGGITRGPGHSKLDFGDESSAEGTKFKEEELPAADLQALKESRLEALSKGVPEVGKEKAGSSGSGALAGARAGGGSANTQVILPRHRGAVERYFDRSSSPGKPKK